MISNKTIFSNFMWRFAERSGAQFIQFVVSIVLARILAPEAFGTIALVLVFSQILNVFVDSGLGNALIQKKIADDLDFSTVFYFNISVCLVLYIVAFFSAPFIAIFYNDTSLTAIVRVLCLIVVLSGVRNVQQAYISRTMQFKRFFYATIGGTITSAVVGIGLAITGFGIWALVVQKITNLFVGTVILWITVKWRPKKMFSLERLQKLFSFGWKLLLSSLLDVVYNNLRQLIIGKFYTKSDLAFYNQGHQFPNLIVTNINSSINSVLLPMMSREQDYTERVKSMTRRAIKTSTYVMAPLLVGLAFVASPVVELLLTEKWLPCVPFLRIFCVIFLFQPIHTANLNAINAMGRSDLFLKLEIMKKIIGLTVLFITMWHGVMIMAYSLLFTSVLSQIINAWPNRKLLHYSYIEQLNDICPNILLAIFMGVCISPITLLHISSLLTLLIQIPLGVMIYVIGSVALKNDSFRYLWLNVKPVLDKQLHKKKN